jgi:hypothetical protein
MYTFLPYFFAVLLLTSTPSGQPVLLSHIDGKAAFITSDELSDIYVIKNDVMEKYDEKGKLLYSYSPKSLGQIDFVDAADPLKVLVFYKSFPQFAVLDNTLTMNGESFSLQDYSLEQTTLMCTSYEHGFWLYDQANLELQHLNEIDMTVNKTTGNIGQLLNIKLHPNFLVEKNNKVFLNDPEIGILVFDVFGAYFKTLPLKNLNNFQVNGDQIIYYSGKKLNSYNYKTLTDDSYPLPDTTAIAVRVEKSRMFIQNEKGIDIYEVK